MALNIFLIRNILSAMWKISFTKYKYFVKDIFLYAKQVVHLALPPVRFPILHLRLPSVATMESVFPGKSHKNKI